MKNVLTLIFAFSTLAFFVNCKSKPSTNNSTPSVGRIDLLDDALFSIIDTNARIEILADSFLWSEGPLWLESENKLIFTDVPANAIYSWDEKAGKQLYLKPSGYTIQDTTGGAEGANGLMLDLEGNLILCQHGNRAIAKMKAPLSAPKSDFDFIATQYKGKRFSSPNDLYIARDGDIFFTDPPYGLPGYDSSSVKELKYNGVFRLRKDGTVTLLDSTMTKPNGVVLSADERSMIVANSDPKAAYWKKYILDDNKNVISSSVFADATDLVSSLKGLPDGLKIGKKGHIFASGPGGILIFDPAGKKLGTIMTENATANCALDAKNEYLYMTAHSYLMRVKLKM